MEFSLKEYHREYNEATDEELEEIIEKLNRENRDIWGKFEEREEELNGRLASMNLVNRFFHKLYWTVTRTDPNPFPYYLITPFPYVRQQIAEGILERRRDGDTHGEAFEIEGGGNDK